MPTRRGETLHGRPSAPVSAISAAQPMNAQGSRDESSGSVGPGCGIGFTMTGADVIFVAECGIGAGEAVRIEWGCGSVVVRFGRERS